MEHRWDLNIQPYRGETAVAPADFLCHLLSCLGFLSYETAISTICVALLNVSLGAVQFFHPLHRITSSPGPGALDSSTSLQHPPLPISGMASGWENLSVPQALGMGAVESPNTTAATPPGPRVDEMMAPLCDSCCCSLLGHTMAVVFMASLAFAIVGGNVITLVVFIQTRQFRTPQGLLKVSLALADMIVGVLVVPFSIFTEIMLMATSAPPVWVQGDSPASVGGFGGAWQPCKLIGPVFAGCTFVSISTIFLMTAERSVAVLWPLHKDSMVTRSRMLLLIFLSWAGSFLLALAPLFLSDSFTLEYNGCSRMCNYVPWRDGAHLAPDTNVLLLFPIFDFTLLGGTLVVNILSFTRIRHHTHKRKLLSEGGHGRGYGAGCPCKPSFSDIKAAKTIGILTVTFTASFSPIAVFVLGSVLGYTWCSFSFFAFWMLTANSCCNVIIYSMRDHRFRKGVGLLFHRDRARPQGENS